MSKVNDEVKADCPNCGKRRWAVVVAVVQDHQDDGPVWSSKSHRILQCPACKGFVHQTDFVFSEDMHDYQNEAGEWEQDYDHTIEQWPSVSTFEKGPPAWMDKLSFRDRALYKLLRDTYTAVENDLKVFAAVGIRTAFDRASELLGVDDQLSFEGKLKDLLQKQHIGPIEKDQLSVATDAGNAAAHRGWEPSAENLRIALEVVEGFIYRTLILPVQTERLKDSIPARGTRK